MKVLFVHPAVHDFSCHDFWLKPYGLLKLAGLFDQQGAQVHFFDFLDRFADDVDPCFQKMDQFGRGRFPRTFISKPAPFNHVPRRFKRYGRDIEVFKKYLSGIAPLDAVFITCSMTYWYPGVSEILPHIGEVPVYLGGIYATLFQEHARSIGVRPVTAREMPAFLAQFGFSMNQLHSAVPYWKAYSSLPYIVVRSTWGCPFKCTYCAVRSLFPEYVTRETEDAYEEVVRSLRPETEHLVFYDDALLSRHEALFQLCRKVLRFRTVQFHTPNGLSVNHVSETVASGLRMNNFSQIYLGFETHDDRIHERIGNKTSSVAFKRAVTSLKKASYPSENIHAYLLMGHDLISPSSVEQSIIEAIREGIMPALADYSPIPGTGDGDRVLPDHPFDPLITNKTSWTYRWAPPEKINRLRKLSHSA